MKRLNVKNLVTAAVCLALCLVLPFLTGQIPQIGGPMHIPVLLGGFLCGPWWAVAVGLSAPLLRHILFHMPPLITAVAMCFELGTYGLVSGLLYRRLPGRNSSIYVSLIAAMIAGRVVWGAMRVALSGASGEPFTWAAFMAGAFFNAIPGIIVHIALIPALVIVLKRAGVFHEERLAAA